MFTELQKEELLHRIGVRQDTIDEDPESACGIEMVKGSLDTLKLKLELGEKTNFTQGEIYWMIEELDDMISIGRSNRGTEGIVVEGYINSMNNAKTKLAQLHNIKFNPYI